jgi:hypothetical protein
LACPRFLTSLPAAPHRIGNERTGQLGTNA